MSWPIVFEATGIKVEKLSFFLVEIAKPRALGEVVWFSGSKGVYNLVCSSFDLSLTDLEQFFCMHGKFWGGNTRGSLFLSTSCCKLLDSLLVWLKSVLSECCARILICEDSVCLDRAVRRWLLSVARKGIFGYFCRLMGPRHKHELRTAWPRNFCLHLLLQENSA